MSRDDMHIAQVLPSPLAVEQEIERQTRAAPGGMFLVPPLFHIENLLPAVLAGVPPPPGRTYLDDAAGPILLHRLLHESTEETELYAGLQAGWRLPDRLWRLLVEVRAAGLDASRLAGLAAEQSTPGLGALARLMGRYERELDKLNLLDQADRMAALDRMLEQGRRPAVMRDWKGLQVRQVIWLRALDLRLLSLLSRVMPVEISFCRVPEMGSAGPLYRLIRATWRFLESDENHKISISWEDLETGRGAFPHLIDEYLVPGREISHSGPERLTLVREAGRYAEVEHLLRLARDLVQSGVPAQEIGIVFPDLTLYGQMAADVAGRLNLAVSTGAHLPLGRFPLVQAVLNLLSLGLEGYAAPSLAAVWESPYLAWPLAALLGVEQPRGVARLLNLAGYLDAREAPVSQALQTAARRVGRARQELTSLAQACAALEARLKEMGLHGGRITLARFAVASRELLESLDIGRHLLQSDRGAAAPWASARDLASLTSLSQELEQMERATGQAGQGPEFSLGRCLQVLRGLLDSRSVRLPGGDPFGVKVLQQDQAVGLELHTIMLGGLNLGEFPLKPAGQNLLGAAERMALGRASRGRLPVWRTDQEEYSGQVLRWLWLMSSARERVVLSCSAADSAGKPLEPANPLLSLLPRLGETLPEPRGGVYGDLPELADCLEPATFLARLAADLLRPGASGADLAQAALFAWTRDPDGARRWSEIAERAQVENAREDLNLAPVMERFAQADAYSGLMVSRPAQDLISQVVGQERFCRLSPTGLEGYLACPLAWFSQRILGVKEPEVPGWGVEPALEGGWVHLTLKKFFDPAEFNPSFTARQIQERLALCLDQAANELKDSGAPGHPNSWAARREPLLAALGRVVEREMAEMGSWRPTAVESQVDLPLSQEGEPELHLHGILDRLDQAPSALRVTDYKHVGNHQNVTQAVRPDNLGVSAFQVPIYLAAALDLQGKGVNSLTGRLVNTRRPGENPALVDLDPDGDLLTRDPDRRAQLAASLTPNLFNAVWEAYRRMRSGDFVALPEPDTCRYCSLGLVCRARPAVETTGEE